MARRIIHMIEQGAAVHPEQHLRIERYLMNHLIKAPSLNTVESAHYAVAEIHLRRGDHQKCLQRLQQVLREAGERQDNAVWLTHLNIANISRIHLGDVQQAIREYALVKGPLAGYAQGELLRTFEEMGQVAEAVAILQKRCEAATDKGAKLSLLKQIADLYARNNDEEKAIAAYDRIAGEFTSAEVEKMKKAAAQYVLDQADEVIRLRNAHRFEEAERVMHQVRRRETLLRSQGRTDELQAFREAMPQAMEKIEEWERRHRPEPPANGE
ncbi:MAG: hypothetical protein ISS78_02940 [Phycisphaerae bacterium]|nr:hypothetical protein [Phycisphaerae bacterium]